MNSGPDRKVVYALLAVAALCLIGLGATLYRTKAHQLTTLEKDLAEKQDKLVELQEKLRNQPELEEEYARLQDRLSTLEPSLPDSAYIPTFLRQIEILATNTGNEITTIRPKPLAVKPREQGKEIDDETGELIKGATKEVAKAGEPQKPKLPYDLVPIELKLKGTYDTALSFLAELQRFPKMIAVNDIMFQPDNAAKKKSRIPALAIQMDLTAVVTKGGTSGKQG